VKAFNAEVTRLLAEAAAAPTADAKGKKYEALLVYVFGAVPGALVEANLTTYFGAEQVDIAVSNGGAFPTLPEHFLVECKNYDHPLDSKSVGYFLFICLSREAKLAVIVAANGLTGDANESTFAHSLAMSASPMGCKLIVLTTADLQSLQTPTDLAGLLRQRYLRAFANSGIGTG